MFRWVYTLGDIDNKANLLPMKSDIHDCFDRRWFVIVPKKTTATSSDSKYVVHIISPDAGELWSMYQNAIVQPGPRSKAYLFARFAWTILLRVKPFLFAGPKRFILRVTDVDDNKALQYVCQEVSRQSLLNDYGGGGSRNATPLERSRIASLAGDEDNAGLLTDSSDEANLVCDPWDMPSQSNRR